MKKSSHSPNSRGSVLRLIAEKTVWKKKKERKKSKQSKAKSKKINPQISQEIKTTPNRLQLCNVTFAFPPFSQQSNVMQRKKNSS